MEHGPKVDYLNIIRAITSCYRARDEAGIKKLYEDLLSFHAAHGKAAYAGITVDLNIDWLAQRADKKNAKKAENWSSHKRSPSYAKEITKFCRETLGYDTTRLDDLTKHF